MNTKIDAQYDCDENLTRDTRGLSTVEYLILLVVIGVAGITVWQKVGESIDNKATSSRQSLDSMQ
ncbi:MAG: hypothetical protein GY811_01835 [Myxococcales bacterium]|nr:hypothetical protein [Myxococcales bacterium]